DRTNSGGVSVTTARFDPDQATKFSILVAPLRGAGSVRQFDIADITVDNMFPTVTANKFNPYPSQYTGGMFIAAADLNADQVDDLIVGAAGDVAGLSLADAPAQFMRDSHNPQIMILDGKTGT